VCVGPTVGGYEVEGKEVTDTACEPDWSVRQAFLQGGVESREKSGKSKSSPTSARIGAETFGVGDERRGQWNLIGRFVPHLVDSFEVLPEDVRAVSAPRSVPVASPTVGPARSARAAPGGGIM
jgi:hypothetical protein